MSDYTSRHRLGADGVVYTVVLHDGLQPHQTEPRLYHVTCSSRDHHIDVRPAASIDTQNAAVNGIQNDLDRAAVVMLDKVNATADLRRDAQPSEYTLYHVPTRGAAKDMSLAAQEMIGVSTSDAKALSQTLEGVSKSGRNVIWSVHSRGAAVFESAVQDSTDRGVHLGSQSVAVYNGAVNTRRMAHDLRKADMPMVGRGFYNYAYDPVPQLIGGNTENPIKMFGSLYNSRAVVFSDQSPHTWHMPLKERDYRSVPSAQWQQPGVDLRAKDTAPQPPGRHPADATSVAPALKNGTVTSLDPAMLRSAGIEPGGPLYSALMRIGSAAESYANSPPEERVALLDRLSAGLKHDIGEPALTGAPLRQQAMRHVKGEVSAQDLVGAAQKHSAAARLQQSLHRVAITPDLGLAR